MKKNKFRKFLKSLGALGFISFCFPLFCNSIIQLRHSQNKIISVVDTSLNGSQKYVLRVDGKPFYMTNIQIRLDKLRYYWGWNAMAREAIVAQAAMDGFNTVSIPIHWYEVETSRDNFDWGILDEYLGLAEKYKLKMELLWFGQNSGGHVQWLGNPDTNPVHLRTPDYVLYSPKPGSAATTSDYRIRRDISDYTLDLEDNNLREREKYVLEKVMSHIARWDADHGYAHTLIGIQLNNEVRGMRIPFSNACVLSYMSDLATAIKESNYVVWTRLNCVYVDLEARIADNEKMRLNYGTNIDFVGVDSYRHHFNSDQSYIESMRTNIPYKNKNYRMIMEIGAEVSNIAQLQLAALSGNNAFDYYDMCGPDGHGLYDKKDVDRFVPHGEYIGDVRLVNKILNSDIVDIALNANGHGLFVHNWEGIKTVPTKGVKGIIFMPAYPTSQGISISRSDSELVLMSTKGGTFFLA